MTATLDIATVQAFLLVAELQSFTRAAEALGLSRRMVAYYSNGEKPVPKTVLLACRGWEVGRRLATAR